MSDIDDIVKELITSRPKGRGKLKLRGPLDLPSLPDPGGLKDSIDEIKKSVEQVVEGLTGLKDIPKTLLGGISEVESDFRKADKEFRGARIRGPRRK